MNEMRQLDYTVEMKIVPDETQESIEVAIRDLLNFSLETLEEDDEPDLETGCLSCS